MKDRNSQPSTQSPLLASVENLGLPDGRCEAWVVAMTICLGVVSKRTRAMPPAQRAETLDRDFGPFTGSAIAQRRVASYFPIQNLSRDDGAQGKAVYVPRKHDTRPPVRPSADESTMHHSRALDRSYRCGVSSRSVNTMYAGVTERVVNLQ